MYLHIWSGQPSSQDCNLASHATYVLAVNFRYEGRYLELNVDTEWQIFLIRVFARNQKLIV